MRLAALLLVLTLAAGATAEPQPFARGTLRLAMVAPLDTLDPAKAASETERIVVGNVYDQLYEHDHLARPYRLRPSLAAAPPEISEGGRLQTIRLRKGVTFVDDRCFPESRGRELTAHDVVFCLKRVMDATVKSPGQWMLQRKIEGLDAFVTASAKLPANPSRSAYQVTEGYPEVSGLEVLDDYTLRIRLLEPTPELAWLLACPWFGIYPREAVRTYAAGFGGRAVTTGAHRVVLFLKGRNLVLRRNPAFRGQTYPDDGPRGSDLRDRGLALPRNETTEVTVYESPLQAWAAFTAGKADLAEIPRDAFTAAVDPATGTLLPHLAQQGITLHRDPRLELFYDAFNWADPILGGKAGAKGRAIRYAICLAADEVWAMTRLYTHRSERLRGPILPDLNAFDPRLVNESLRGEDESEEAALEAARGMLAEAGYDEAHPVPPLRMHILSDKTSRVVFDVLQRQVARVGIRLEPVPVTWPAMQATLKAGKAQMWTSSWYADYPDAQNFLQLFYGPNAPEPNYANYHNEEVDELYEAARALPPGDERDDLLNDLEAIVVRDCPWRYRFRRVRWTAVRPHVRGFRWNDIAPKHFKHLGVDPAK